MKEWLFYLNSFLGVKIVIVGIIQPVDFNIVQRQGIVYGFNVGGNVNSMVEHVFDTLLYDFGTVVALLHRPIPRDKQMNRYEFPVSGLACQQRVKINIFSFQ